MDQQWTTDPIEEMIEEGQILKKIEKMEHWLIGEAFTGATRSLDKIIGDRQNQKILTKTLEKCSNWSPLHVAAAHGRTDFVNKLLLVNPDLTQVLDSQQWSALHVAAARGHKDTVEILSSKNSMMCLARDQHGRNPLHTAAMNGHDQVLELFFENKKTRDVAALAARVRLDTQETILHLCVKHDQLKNLVLLMKLICDPEFFNAKDVDGNTVLHLAVKGRRKQMVEFLLNDGRVEVNETNGSGQTAMDVADKTEPGQGHADYETHRTIRDLLNRGHARKVDDLVFGDPLESHAKKRDTLIVAASLIATMAFQAGVNPPGGFWVDTSGEHIAGEAIFGSNHPYLYSAFLWVNTIGFIGSLSTVLLLVTAMPSTSRYYVCSRTFLMCLISSAMAVTYSFSIYITLPTKFHKPPAASLAVVIVILVWVAITSTSLIWRVLYLIRGAVNQERERKEAEKRIQQSRSSSQGV